MLKEEKNYKSRLLDSLEKSESTIMKLRREMGIRYVILFLFFKFLKVIFSTLALSWKYSEGQHEMDSWLSYRSILRSDDLVM